MIRRGETFQLTESSSVDVINKPGDLDKGMIINTPDPTTPDNMGKRGPQNLGKKVGEAIENLGKRTIAGIGGDTYAEYSEDPGISRNVGIAIIVIVSILVFAGGWYWMKKKGKLK